MKPKVRANRGFGESIPKGRGGNRKPHERAFPTMKRKARKQERAYQKDSIKRDVDEG